MQELIGETGAAMFDAWVEAELGEIALQRGDPAEHERRLREAQHLFADMGATGWARQTEEQLAALPA
jgi:hypothetical protein